MPDRPSSNSRSLAPVVLLAVVALTVCAPAVGVLASIGRGMASSAPLPVPIHWSLFWPTVGWCGLIAVLATMAAAPAAWAVRRGRGVAAMLIVPLLLPTYLAYAAWGMLRAPGTWLGDVLMRGPAGVDAGQNWWPVAAGRAQAILGLTLWAWPLAALVMAAWFLAVDDAVLDQLRVDGARWWRRGAAVLAMTWVGVAAGAAAVFLVVVGSAVPLHLAQMDSYAIAIWRLLDELPWEQRWRVWIAAWPLLAIALGAGLVFTRRVVRSPWQAGESGGRAGAAAMTGAAVVWSLAVLVPLAVMVKNLNGVRPLITFWRLSWGSVVSSVEVSLGVAAVAVVIVGSAWRAAEAEGRWARQVGAVCLGALVITGLTPGILVGSAVGQAWNREGLRWVGDTALVVVLGHIARFGFVAAMAGWFFAESEPGALRDLRRIDAGGSLAGWLEGAVRPRLALAAAAVLACAVLSFHEIESAVMLQPPTSAGGGFAWKMLQALHFNREEDLVPAMVTVTVVGLIGAGAVAWLLRGARGSASRGGLAAQNKG